jgi:hypothetical protein
MHIFELFTLRKSIMNRLTVQINARNIAAVNISEKKIGGSLRHG